ncbi:MAG: hypothetical protein ACD_72C00166G0001, partial [uncultured bacterium]
NNEQRRSLLNERGEFKFELLPALGATLEDLDITLLDEYRKLLGLDSVSNSGLLIGRDMASMPEKKPVINMAGILLFGKNPEKWHPRARLRILRFEGKVEHTGTRLNITKDIYVGGPIINQVRESQQKLENLLRDFSTLSKTGKFTKEKEYPDFTWREAIVNALIHRDYTLEGADIQVKMFEDHIEVVSPGRFPGFVNEHNIKDVHYSRNPRIARIMAEMGFVKEVGEGVNRIYEEMGAANLPQPLFKEESQTQVVVTLFNSLQLRRLVQTETLIKKIETEIFHSFNPYEQQIVLFVLDHDRITTQECQNLINKSRTMAFRYLEKLVSRQFLKRVGQKGPKVYYATGLKINTPKKQQDIDKSVVLGQRQERLF